MKKQQPEPSQRKDPEPSRYQPGQITEEQARAVAVMLHSVWPRSPDGVEIRTAEILAGMAPDSLRLVVWEAGRPVAHAFTFERWIHAPGQSLRVMGLASLAVAPEYRGRGMGEFMARTALERVDLETFSHALFQTQVPKFYEKLGARVVDNQFFNRSANNRVQESPWWEPFVMIYPGLKGNWPTGRVDLNGPGY